MNIDNDERPTILEYVEAAYLHGLCVENLDTDELEPPRDISEVAWIAEKIEERFAAQRQALRDEVLNKATSLAKDILYVASEKERKVYSEKPSKGVGLNELRTAISTIFEGKE